MKSVHDAYLKQHSSKPSQLLPGFVNKRTNMWHWQSLLLRLQMITTMDQDQLLVLCVETTSLNAVMPCNVTNAKSGSILNATQVTTLYRCTTTDRMTFGRHVVTSTRHYVEPILRRSDIRPTYFFACDVLPILLF